MYVACCAVVLQVDGRSASTLSSQALEDLVQGEEGTVCVLTLKNTAKMIQEVPCCLTCLYVHMCVFDHVCT